MTFYSSLTNFTKIQIQICENLCDTTDIAKTMSSVEKSLISKVEGYKSVAELSIIKPAYEAVCRYELVPSKANFLVVKSHIKFITEFENFLKGEEGKYDVHTNQLQSLISYLKTCTENINKKIEAGYNKINNYEKPITVSGGNLVDSLYHNSISESTKYLDILKTSENSTVQYDNNVQYYKCLCQMHLNKINLEISCKKDQENLLQELLTYKTRFEKLLEEFDKIK